MNFSSNFVEHLFSWYDYTFFSIMLIISTVIGVYFGFFGKQQSTPEEYLMGGKKMKVIPVALSLASSTISGTIFLLYPADVYQFGFTLILDNIAVVSVYLITYIVFIPVYYKLKLTSINEYLELRFNSKVRMIASFIYGLCTFLYLPIAIYSPSLAFVQVTGANLHVVAISASVVCIFYTTIGGLKTVIWTDALQFFVMFGASFWITYMGIVDVGGLTEIYEKSYDTGRLTFDFDPDLTKRDTVLSIIVGINTLLLGFITINPGFVQKCLSLPTMISIKRSMIIFGVVCIVIKTLFIFTGLVIYTKYFDCDPLISGKIKRIDQIVPLYIMDVSRSSSGIAGIFIAGIFSAGLSTLSALMNSLACTLYEDFISLCMPKDITPKRVSNILKLLVIVIGVIGISLFFLIEKVKNILPIIFCISGITMGPLIGLFIVGMVFPIVNTKGAMTGILSSLAISSFIIIKAEIYKAQGYFKYPSKPISIEGCENLGNITLTQDITSNDFEPYYIFRISHYYYGIMGTLLVVIIALPVSYFTKSNSDKVIGKDVISPISHWCMKDNATNQTTNYDTVEGALELVYSDNKKQ